MEEILVIAASHDPYRSTSPFIFLLFHVQSTLPSLESKLLPEHRSIQTPIRRKAMNSVTIELYGFGEATRLALASSPQPHCTGVVRGVSPFVFGGSIDRATPEAGISMQSLSHLSIYQGRCPIQHAPVSTAEYKLYVYLRMPSWLRHLVFSFPFLPRSSARYASQSSSPFSKYPSFHVQNTRHIRPLT